MKRKKSDNFNSIMKRLRAIPGAAERVAKQLQWKGKDEGIWGYWSSYYDESDTHHYRFKPIKKADYKWPQLDRVGSHTVTLVYTCDGETHRPKDVRLGGSRAIS